jgi:hypothetical protein
VSRFRFARSPKSWAFTFAAFVPSVGAIMWLAPHRSTFALYLVAVFATMWSYVVGVLEGLERASSVPEGTE